MASGKQKSLDHQLPNQPKEIFYCTKCVVSNQRPRITFDEDGVCSACSFSAEKDNVIDWDARAKELKQLCDKYRRNDGWYDVLVPASGGKDSTSVAYKLKHEYGMNPLTVTWAPFLYTEPGWVNLMNFIQAGYNNILMHPSGHIHRKLAKCAFEAVGDAFQPFMYGQYLFPIHMAVKFNIPLVFYGENGEAEYGGDTKNNHNRGWSLDDYMEYSFKGVNIDRMLDWGKEQGYITDSDYNESDLAFYRPPPVQLLRDNDVQFHWFSYYHKWIPQENYYTAVERAGFQANDERNEGTYSKYASFDDKLDGFHYYLMLIKFGIGRATSDAAHEVRDGHLTREEAVALVQRYDTEFPQRYFPDFLEYLDITEEKFWEVIDSYRPEHLWKKVGGNWELKFQVS